MKWKILIALLSLIIISSCGNSKEKDIKGLKDMETALKTKSDADIDVVKAKELVDAYIKFVKDYPKDSSSANCLFKAATLSMNIGKYQLSVDLFDQILADYPTFSKIADCVFFKAFVYDNNLNNIKKAREGYEEYLKKYPTEMWAKDIPGLLKVLGKTSEEISAELNKKNPRDSLVNK